MSSNGYPKSDLVSSYGERSLKSRIFSGPNRGQMTAVGIMNAPILAGNSHKRIVTKISISSSKRMYYTVIYDDISQYFRFLRSCNDLLPPDRSREFFIVAP